MLVVIAWLLALLLLAVCWGVQVLEREIRRQGCAVRETQAESTETVKAANRTLDKLVWMLADMKAEHLAPWDEEAQRSAEIMEGFNNLMGYSVGTARGKDVAEQ